MKRSDLIWAYRAILGLSKSAIADAWYTEFRKNQRYKNFLRARGLLEEAKRFQFESK